ncbi:MAG: hypothetical protein JWN34_2 [Bryobacterales bacterium]|nr:hypothetical protein [Bryobacterales bacterium]
MRSLRAPAALILLSVSLFGAAIPISHLDSATAKAFDDYIATFEKGDPVRFAATGKLWVDKQCCGGKSAGFEEGKPALEARLNKDVADGSIHHYSGAIRVPGATIESARRVMQDYANYVKYFKNDLGAAKGERLPDSTPEDEHFSTDLQLVQTTLWINVTYDTKYDVHYRRLAKDRWTVRSVATRIREQRDPKNPAAGYFPEGEDHGFLWKTNTYWSVRERDGGLDMQVDSISLSRPSPVGVGWWGNRRAKDAVENMLRDTKAAIESRK